MRLEVLHSYRSRDLSYEAGQVIEVDTERAAFLMRDAPGCFREAVPAETKALDAPPVDKQVKRAPRRK